MNESEREREKRDALVGVYYYEDPTDPSRLIVDDAPESARKSKLVRSSIEIKSSTAGSSSGAFS